MNRLRDDLSGWLEAARQRAAAATLEPRVVQRGFVERVGDGVASVTGLAEARQDELLRFGAEVWGTAVVLEPDRIGCILLSAMGAVSAGTEVTGTGRVVTVPVGEGLLGRVIDPLGRPLDNRPPPEAERLDPVDRSPPSIVERDLVTEPLLTGVTLVDAMIPLGRGQRELIIGDPKTGKTALAVDTILNQKAGDVICVYAAIGQKASSVHQVIDAVRTRGAPERCVFVVGEADSPPGLQWLTPYAACTIGEYFMEQGRDVLLVIDDLTKHAAVYRQLSLLLRRPPGREAYPGDVFYLHARLLERSARLDKERGGGSLTALPIAETQAGNLTAYIPTNLVSITDGQIYLEPKLFYEGQKPAVNVGMSVSRVGGRTQPPALRALAESLRLEYAQFLELEVFTRFGAMVDDRTRRAVEHGRRIRAILVQPRYATRPLALQIALLLALSKVLDGLSLAQVDGFKSRLAPWLAEACPDLAARIDATGKLRDGDRTDLEGHLRRLAETLKAEA